MKYVLISIKPKQCELIASGKKTIEVRKTKPKIATPFKSYIYCTKNGRPLVYGSPCPSYVEDNLVQTYGYSKEKAEEIFGCWNGKVIGEFACDDVIPLHDTGEAIVAITDYDIENCCLNYDELHAYANGKFLYGWHISDLKIYDNPKELKTFEYLCPHKPHCETCKYSINEETFCGEVSVGCYRYLQYPPQSWCYVEEI